MAEEINDVISAVEKMQRNTRNIAKSRGPLKGVGDGNEFPNNPLSLYPAPALEVGDTWWKFNHRNRDVTYLYDVGNTRWLSSEAFHVRLNADLYTVTPTLTSLDLDLVPSGTFHDVAVQSVYSVVFQPSGTHDASNHIELVLSDYDVVTGVTTSYLTLTTDLMVAGAATLYDLTALYHEATQGSALQLEGRSVGSGATAFGVQVLITYRTIG